MITSHKQYKDAKEYAEIMQIVIAVAEEAKNLKADRRDAIVTEATAKHDELLEQLETWESQTK